jgi:putative FmdB family regulatory protein
MPLYEYECDACHRRVEKIQKFSDPELTECPHCGGRLERTVTAPSFQFAGGGWYKDLYASSKPGGDAKPEAAGAKPDAKPATADSSSTTPSSAPAAAAPSAPAPSAPSSTSSTSKT